MKRVLFIALTLFLTLSATSSAQQPQESLIDGVVAVVNNDIILNSDIMGMLQIYVAANRIDPQTLTPERILDIYKTLLDQMVRRKVEVMLAFQDTNVVLEETEVDDAIEKRVEQEIQRFGSQEEMEQQYQMPILKIREMLTERTRDDLLIDKLHYTKMRDVTITRTEVAEYYESVRDSLPEQPARYDVSQILISPRPTEEQLEVQRAFADSLRQRILNGEDFGELARQFSDDPGSASRGGEYDYIQYGQFMPAFEETVRKMEIGDISEPVRIDYGPGRGIGFHVIEVLDKQQGTYKPRHILILSQGSEEETVAKLDELRERTLSGEDFGELSAEFSTDTGVATNKGRIGDLPLSAFQEAYPEFAQALAPMKVGEISRPFKTEQFGYHILKLTTLTPAHTLSLEKDYNYIQGMAMQEKQISEYNAWFDEAKKEIFIDVKKSLLSTEPDTSSTIRQRDLPRND